MLIIDVALPLRRALAISSESVGLGAVKVTTAPPRIDGDVAPANLETPEVISVAPVFMLSVPDAAVPKVTLLRSNTPPALTETVPVPSALASSRRSVPPEMTVAPLRVAAASVLATSVPAPNLVNVAPPSNAVAKVALLLPVSMVLATVTVIGRVSVSELVSSSVPPPKLSVPLGSPSEESPAICSQPALTFVPPG